MNILVCVKQVPGSNNVEVDPVTGVLKRNGIQSKINPYDLYGIETALSLAEKHGGSTWSEAMRAQAKELADLLGGLVSGEHGIGYAKKEFLKKQYGETPIALMQGIKQVFDLKNILNPGKVCF